MRQADKQGPARPAPFASARETASTGHTVTGPDPPAPTIPGTGVSVEPERSAGQVRAPARAPPGQIVPLDIKPKKGGQTDSESTIGRHRLREGTCDGHRAGN